MSGNLIFVGYFHRGLPTGYCWLAKEGQGWLFGEVDERGHFSGDNIAYIYPDLLTAITGTFEKEVMCIKGLSGLISNNMAWYFVTKIVLTYCEKKMF